jgi:hypothetical protein
MKLSIISELMLDAAACFANGTASKGDRLLQGKKAND